MVFYNKKNGAVYVNGVASPSLSMLAGVACPLKSIFWITKEQCELELQQAAGLKLGQAFKNGIQQGETWWLIHSLDGHTR